MKKLDIQGLHSFGGGGSRSIAFTLAEMMVVLLIMSIVLACLAPAMTTKMKAEQNVQTSPWKWVQQGGGRNLDAYFGNGNMQMAHIGETQRSEGDNAKLIINNSNLDDMILFKNGNNTLGHLRMTSDSVVLGTLNNEAEQGGVNVRSGFAVWNDGVAVGRSASAGNRGTSFGIRAQSGTGAVALGDSSTAGANGVAVGYDVNAVQDAIAIGNTTRAFAQSVSIGNNIDNSSDNSVSIGHGSSVTDVGGTAVGDGAIASSVGTSLGSNAAAVGDNSVAIGSNATAGTETTSLSYGNSIAIGNNAQALGEDNIAIGRNSLFTTNTYNSVGAGNVAIGAEAMYYHYSINVGNTAVGYKAMKGSSRSSHYWNTAIGYEALTNAGTTSGSAGHNTAVGYQSLYSDTTGNYNTAVGVQALKNNTTGSFNTAIGESACANVTGSNKTCIGYKSGPSSNHAWATDDYERIFIGGRSSFNGGPAALEVHNGVPGVTISSSRGLAGTVVVINGALLVKGGIVTSMPWVDDNRFNGEGGVNLIGRTGGQLEPVDVDWNGASNQLSGEYGGSDRGTFKSPNSHNDYGFSDRRLKYVGKENHDGLAKLRQIKVFNYTFKKDEKKTPRVGVMAQDLMKIFPNAVKKGADGFLTIRMEDMFYAVINAIKELDAKYQAQEKRINELEKRIQVLESKIK